VDKQSGSWCKESSESIDSSSSVAGEFFMEEEEDHAQDLGLPFQIPQNLRNFFLPSGFPGTHGLDDETCPLWLCQLQAEKIVFCGSFADREKHSSGVVVESCDIESSPIAKQFHDMPRSSILVYVSLDVASADSVSDDYMPYMLWQFPTNVTGWICSTLVTSSLLKVCFL